MSFGLRPSVVLTGSAQPNDTIKKTYRVTSHIPLIQPTPPFHNLPPFQTACSKGLIPMTAPNHTLQLLPTLKSGEYDS